MANNTRVEIPWPKNINLQGLLSFPIASKEDITKLQEWRAKKSIPKPQFPDKIGGSLLLKPAQWDKAVQYLTETYLPFVDELYKLTNGEKGIDPELTKELLDQAKRDVWFDEGDKKKRPNLPLRRLDEKDIKNTGGENSPYVGKVRFSGPFEEAPIEKAAIVMRDGQQTVVPLQELKDDGVLPSSRSDWDALWWGSGWTFRVNMRFNAFDSASVGVAAYAPKIFLLPHLGMPVSGGTDADVIEEDGDDWDDSDD
ncbi:hypothetical protein SEA_YELLOWPANDA_15 [Microbacterium phage YellowPanda]|uniref:Uncharacterized protein n=2 Tax=Tinytimothyvirus tinytimothy TaxID=2845596 RepID=A0A5Q2WIM9_9CAUD|nr:hypothetical protein HWC33_gp15 [Microbacterium phage TinyTimothy]QDF16968.1 hypothetical protein SEA_TINYTIMOTHY_15 [Microbacterium phage TinyTimothy]QGH78656.1 hypothetical protein SEA_WESAK_15 [Microbacterium phage Wesak]